ncbi:GerMN domain-containing protein [Alteribacillus sp. HJP-4]|uniref:GerMN domain-containing protein n=1 Tax=Alteribacillus sp. HJP-4 TaxID=2775394 RepID=UPI0035CCEC40
MRKYSYAAIAAILGFSLLTACGTSEENGSPEENDAEEMQETEGTDEVKEQEETPEDEEEAENEEEETDDTDAEEESDSEEKSDSEEETDSEEESADLEETASEEEDTSSSAEDEEKITETVTLFFSDEQLLETLKVDQEVTAASEDEIPLAALEAWIAGPESDELTSLFEGTNVEVQSVEGHDGTAEVSFSESLLDANAGSSMEIAFTEQIALIMQQFGYDQTKVLINGEEEETLFGNNDATEPIQAGNPDDYESVD